jgi:hypothetical protein
MYDPNGRRQCHMHMRKTAVIVAAAVSFALAAPGAAMAATGGGSTPSHQTSIAAQAVPNAAASPDYELALHPRVGCGGGDGTLQWGGNGSIAIPAYLSYDGNVYNFCPKATVYMYLEYTWEDDVRNIDLGKAAPGQNIDVHYATDSDFAQYGDIRVTACQQTTTTWSCGDPTGPGA